MKNTVRGGLWLLVLAFSSGLAMAGSVEDGLLHRIEFLGDLNGNGQVDANEALDVLTYSAATVLGATPLTTSPEDVGFESVSHQDAYFLWDTISATALKFNQPVEWDEENQRYTGSIRALEFPGCVATGAVHTTFIRFRWDGATFQNVDHKVFLLNNGYVYNQSPETGYAVWIKVAAGEPAKGTVYVEALWGAGFSQGNTGLAVKAGEWYDLFIVQRSVAGKDYGNVYTYLLPTAESIVDDGGAKQYPEPKFSTGNGLIGYHAQNLKKTTFLRLGAYQDAGVGQTLAAEGRGPFKGAIEKVWSWGRELSEDERFEASAGRSGCRFLLGLVNGKADEFDAVGPADVYEPATMPWSRMRRELTAEHPTLTLRYPLLASYDAGRDQLLSVMPLFEGVGATCPVTVTVNGATVVSDCDLRRADEQSVYLKARYMKADADGNVTISITRTGDLSGTLAFDAIALSGTWQIGKEDGSFSGFRRDGYVPIRAFVGDPDVGHVSRGIWTGGHLYFKFYVPASAIPVTKYTWRTKFLDNSVDGIHKVSFKLNGTEVGFVDGLRKNQAVEFELPAEALVPGLNVIDLDDQKLTGVNSWATLDAHSLKIRNLRKKGLVLIFK